MFTESLGSYSSTAKEWKMYLKKLRKKQLNNLISNIKLKLSELNNTLYNEKQN